MTKYADTPICYGIFKSKRIPLNISQLVNIKSVSPALEAIQLYRVQARNFSDHIYIYEVACTNTQGKIYQGNLFITSMNNPKKAPKAVSDELLQKMAEESARVVLEAFMVSGNLPIYSMSLQFACEATAERYLWLLGVTQLFFSKAKLKSMAKGPFQPNYASRGEKMFMLTTRYIENEPEKEINIVTSGKKGDEKAETRMLGFRKTSALETNLSIFKETSRNNAFLRIGRNKSYETIIKRRNEMLKNSTVGFTKPADVSSCLGVTQIKWDGNHKKNDISYMINRRVIRNYKSTKESSTLKIKEKICPGDFCKHSQKPNQPMTELLIFLGRLVPQITKEISNHDSMNYEIINIPQVCQSGIASLASTHTEFSPRREIIPDLIRLTEIIKMKADTKVPKAGPDRDIDLESILATVKQHSSSKIIEVCDICKQSYEKIAKHIIEVLNI